MSHWLRAIHPENDQASNLAYEIEVADERIEGLKVQILALMARRAETEEQARDFACEAESLERDDLRGIIAHNSEAALLSSVESSASIMEKDLLRLYVDSSPFLSELAEGELRKAQTLQESVKRWQSKLGHADNGQ